MPGMIRTGNCGWGFFSARQFAGKDWKSRFVSRLQAYASLFELVEVNSTFYRLPRPKTAEKWYKEAISINKNFEFTVKASQVITHNDRFKGKPSLEAFSSTVEIAHCLKSKIILIQCPASWKPGPENIKAFRRFMKSIRCKDFRIAWEPRGEWLKNPEIIRELCNEFNLIHCVDPLRERPVTKGTYYLRLHGFGKGMVYNYRFSKEELGKLKSTVESLKPRKAYVMFNNFSMYENSREFGSLLFQ